MEREAEVTMVRVKVSKKQIKMKAKKGENTLPQTATPYYQFLIAGLLLIGIGIAIYIYRKNN